MRTGLIVFGVIFLVLAVILWAMPAQTAGATTTTYDDGTVDTRTTYATVAVPWPATLAVGLIGLVLLVLGLTLPGPRQVVKIDTPSRVTHTSESVETNSDGGKRRVVREHHEERKE